MFTQWGLRQERSDIETHEPLTSAEVNWINIIWDGHSSLFLFLSSFRRLKRNENPATADASAYAS